MRLADSGPDMELNSAGIEDVFVEPGAALNLLGKEVDMASEQPQTRPPKSNTAQCSGFKAHRGAVSCRTGLE